MPVAAAQEDHRGLLSPITAAADRSESTTLLDIVEAFKSARGVTAGMSRSRIWNLDSESCHLISKPGYYYDTIIRYYDKCNKGKQGVFYSPYDTIMTLL